MTSRISPYTALLFGVLTIQLDNNLGAAYCELRRWSEAVVALEQALRLRPGFVLARNNLEWARAELRKSGR